MASAETSAARPKSSPRRCSSVRTSVTLTNRKLEAESQARIVVGCGVRLLMEEEEEEACLRARAGCDAGVTNMLPGICEGFIGGEGEGEGRKYRLRRRR